MYGDSILEECFDKAIHSFNARSAFDFVSNIYILESSETSYIGSLEKLVYTIGDMSEIYTRRERDFISSVSEVIVYSPFMLQDRKSSVSCSLIAVNLSDFSDPIYNGIAFMKICNKALNGFNLYLMISDETIYIGHDDLTSNNRVGCCISYPITSKIDWDMLQDSFLYLDNQSFHSFYNSFSEAISSIYECYDNFVSISDSVCYFDEEKNEYICLSNRFLREDDNKDQKQYSKDDFDIEVSYLQESLAFIKTNKVNTLELLIDAERAEIKSNSQDFSENHNAQDSKERLAKYQELLDDPEALIKILKTRRSES